jgi:ProP effector
MEQNKKEVKVDKVRELITLLNAKWPKCFVLEGEVKAYKIGILQDVIEELAKDPATQDYSKTIIRKALRFYTHREAYFTSVKADADRVDLEGNIIDKVLQEHEEFASAEKQALDEARIKKIKEKRKAAQAKKFPKKPFNKFNGKKPGFKPRTNEDGTPVKEGYKKNFHRGPRPNYNNGNGYSNANGERRRPSYDRNSQSAPVVSQRRGPAVAAKPFTPIPADELSIGMKVRVMMGSRTVSAVIKELNKDIVSVELGGMGMIAKVSYDHVGR